MTRSAIKTPDIAVYATIETLDIVDGSKRSAQPCATLTYDRAADTFSIRISPNAKPDDVPMVLEPFVRRGELEVGDAWARRWVEERVVPTGRQNLGEVLKAHGLSEYDEFALLRASKGRSSQDCFVVRDHTPRAHTAARVQAGRVLAAARNDAHLTQVELAQRAGIDQAAVSRIENGQANPTVDLLEDLARALGKSLVIKFEPETAPHRKWQGNPA